MHRVDTPGATQDNRFTDGNQGTGTPATIADAAIFNALQEEIAYCIEQSGIALEKGNNTQLTAALLARFATLAALNAHAGLTNPHGATIAATANRLPLRDADATFEIGAGTQAFHPVRLAQLFANLSGVTTGYLTLPFVDQGGVVRTFILNWGLTGTLPQDTSLAVVFPQAFTTRCLGVFVSEYFNNFSDYNLLHLQELPTKTGVTLQNSGVARAGYWWALGY